MYFYLLKKSAAVHILLCGFNKAKIKLSFYNKMCVDEVFSFVCLKGNKNEKKKSYNFLFNNNEKLFS